MALVDPNIAMSYRGIELPNQLAQYGQVQQIQAAQNQNRMADLQMREYERARTEEEGLRNYLSGADLASPETRAGLARFGKTGLGYSKALTEQETAGLTQRETKFKVAKARQDFMAQTLRDISRNPSDANITAYMEDLASSPLFSAEEKAGISSTASRILGMPIDQRGAFMASQGASPGELKPSTIQVNRGGQTDVAQVPAFGGAPTTIGTYADVLSEKDRADLADKASQRSLAERRFAAEEAARIPKDDPRLVVANTITDSAGNVTQYNKFGEPIGDVKKGVGKPSATYEKTKALQKQMGIDLGRAITELETITKPGGLIEQSTGSGIGRATDTAAGFFGMATPGAIAIGKLKPIADLTLKMVPRFEGPQSDKDTQSYKEAAGQLADASLPTDIRLAAAKEVLRLMKSRQAQFVTSDMATEGLSPTSVDSSNPLLK
jgi:hypothetical protein